jgi:SAM-dependent methyltransferase
MTLPTLTTPTLTTPTLASFTGARDRAGAVRLVHDTGHVEHHDVDRWWREADDVDHRAVARCDGPTIDIGCGPGRLSLALTARAVATLGIDVCRDAVETTRSRGASAIRRDVFATVPGEGRWHWALLVDGNVGIGGDPERLLRRMAQVVRPDGHVLVEVSPQEVDLQGRGRIQDAAGTLGSPFPWAVLGARALTRAARRCGWAVGEQWRDGGRHFVVLRHEDVEPDDDARATASRATASRADESSADGARAQQHG